MSVKAYLKDGEVVIEKGGHTVALDLAESELIQGQIREALLDAEGLKDFARIERLAAEGTLEPGIRHEDVGRLLGLRD